MRDVVIRRWCDVCAADGGDDEIVRVEASETFTVGITAGEDRPPLKALDLCEPHVKALISPLVDVMASVGQTPELPAARATVPGTRPRGRPVGSGTHSATGAYVCDLCGNRYGAASSLMPHIYTAHLGIKGAPDLPRKCDVCGIDIPTQAGRRMHRTMTHGITALQDAYALARA